MGWNGSEDKNAVPVPKKTVETPPSKWRGLIALLVIVVGGIAAWFALRPTAKEIEERAPVKPTKIAETKPNIPTNRVEKVAQEMAPKPAKPTKEDPPKFEKRPGAMQLPSGKVLTFPTPKPGEFRKVYAEGHLYECDHLGNVKDLTRRKLFHTAFELNFLALACEGKTFIPAFLTGLDESAVKEMLTKNYQVQGDETEQEMAELKAYDDMRCSALAYMEQGGKFDDFVNEFASFERKQREARALSLREIMTLYKEGKVEDAKNMAKAASILLEKDGYKPLVLPPHVTEAFSAIPDSKN